METRNKVIAGAYEGFIVNTFFYEFYILLGLNTC